MYRVQITAFIITVIGLFILLTMWSEILNAISQSVTIGTLIIVVYLKWLWKYDFFNKTPDLNGKYKLTIKYDYNGLKKKTMSISIKQDMLNGIHITGETNESTFKSVSARIDNQSGGMILVYTYLSEPKVEFRDRSPIHYGTCKFQIMNKKLRDGVYWTDRKSIGDLKIIDD